MCRSRSVITGLLATVLLVGAFGCLAVSRAGSHSPLLTIPSRAASDAPPLTIPEQGSPSPQAAVAPTASFQAASGATITFVTQNGRAVGNTDPQTLHLPHLVLRRNGALTGPTERTLIVEVTGIEVSPPGVTVTLEIETQHGDPDLGGDIGRRIVVWREARWIANTSGSIQTGVTAVFALEFGETVTSGAETVTTPTDYFRYELTLVEARAPAWPRHTLAGDNAFLMEDQWVAGLPQVQETSEGAAPDELIVYYCDMFPFQRDSEDPTTLSPLDSGQGARLPRHEVPHYVQTELVPRMVEAFRVQTDMWGFPWHQAWTSFRTWEDAERLSVALSDGQTWFHSSAPLRGDWRISINVAGGGTARYDTLTDGLMSTFHHELFHNLQRSIYQKYGGNGDVDGGGDDWQFFTEGMARMASSVGQPEVQFAQASISKPRAYMIHANLFVGGDGLAGSLNKSYEEMSPHNADIYWRFLYEQCGGMKDGMQDPGAGMRVIRRTLEVLYSGEVVDIASSTDVVGALPELMDRALEGSACPFRTYEESLVGFARAIYALRLDGGRCTAPGLPAGCGFYDPNGLYHDPPAGAITYAGTAIAYAEAGESHDAYQDPAGGATADAGAHQLSPPGIQSSFGIDFVDVILDPAANGQPLTIVFYGAPGADARFNVQLWKLMDAGESGRPRRVPSQTAAPEMLTQTDADGHLICAIPAVDTRAYNRLGLIITRVDAKESSDPVGAYTIALHPRATGD